MSGEQEDDLTPDVLEKEAREMGWRPQDQWKGDPEKWIPAEEFVERGRHVLPIVKASNTRLRGELLQRDQRIGTLQEQVENQNVVLEKLEKHYQTANKHAYERARADVKAEMRAAREAGDLDAELDAQDKLTTLDREFKESKEEPKGDKKPNGKDKKDGNTQADPEMTQWYKDNAWFGNEKDKDDLKRTKKIVRIAEDLRDEGNELEGVEFMEECLRVLSEQEGETTPRHKSKVEGAPARGNASSGRGSKSFESLPKDAKQACWDDVETLVGPNKRYKTKGEWEKKYAEIYYSTEE